MAVFAASGASAGVVKRLDLFGVVFVGGVAATLKALDARVPAVGACVIGMIAGIGGGLGRDLLTGEIPVVLRREIYAVASLLGAGVVAVLVKVDLSRPVLIAVTASLIFLAARAAARLGGANSANSANSAGSAAGPEPGRRLS